MSPIEVLDGSTGRRWWLDDLKARIMAESFQPGARVCGAVAKYGVIARHLAGWRGLARKRELQAPAASAPAFVRLVVEAEVPAARDVRLPDTRGIKVGICGAVLHVAPDSSPDRAAAMVAALRKVL